MAGGIGSEREVSLQSGKTIYDALCAAGVNTVMSDLTPDDLSILDDASIDLYYLAYHGQFGEDGQVQTILEDRGCCYVGSGSEASRLAFDKQASKLVFADAGLMVAKCYCVRENDTIQTVAENLAGLGNKFVVKPIHQGSSVGIVLTEGIDQTATAAMECFAKFGDCMVEEFIAGREFTVGIVLGRALPIIEIRSKQAFYDFHAKYIDDATEFLFDTIDDKAVIEKLQTNALTCFNSLGCRHLSRVDFIVDKNNNAYVLEINTLPGFTSHSLLPLAASKAGISKPDLCRSIAEAAWVECWATD